MIAPRFLALALPSALLCAAPTLAHAAGTATVRSSKDGEPIYLDGADTGLRTPATLRNLSPGRHVFTVEGECRTGKADVIIPDGPKVVVQIESVEQTGTLLVQPRPAGATVKLDNAPFRTGEGPMEVACGEHSLAVTLSGYVPAFLTIEVGGGEQVVLPVELEAMGLGTLALTVSPENASVVMDGAVISRTGQPVPAGAHVLQVTADGYAPYEEQFVLGDGETLSFDIALEPDAPTVAVAPVPKAPRGPTWWTLPHTGGVVATGVGLGLGVVAAIELAEMGQMGREYNERVETINTARDYELYPPAYANDYRDDQLIPQRNKAVGLTALSAVLLGSGLTLTLAF